MQQFTFYIEYDTEEVLFSSSSEKQKLKAQDQLNIDLEGLYLSKKFTDVILQVAQGGQQFDSHKFLLAARSPVFAAMFETKSTKEAQEGRVIIEDVRAEVIELLLCFLYTGKIDKTKTSGSEELTVELLAAADKYQIDSLKEVCTELLAEKLTFQTMFNFLLVADLYNAPDLKSRVVDFIAK